MGAHPLKITVLAALLCITPAILTAQGVVQEPEFNDVFAGLDAGKLIPLERQTSTIHAGGGGFMVVGTKAATNSLVPSLRCGSTPAHNSIL